MVDDRIVVDTEKPLKIAMIHVADSGGGAENTVLSLHKALLELGHESHLYVAYKYTDTPHVSVIEKKKTIPGLLRICKFFENKFGWQHLFSPGFRSLDKIIDPETDVVHVHSLWGGGGYADIGALPRLSRSFAMTLTLHEAWLMTGHCACPFGCQRWKSGCGKCPDLQRAPKLEHDGTRFNWWRKRLALRSTHVRITTVSAWLKKQVLNSPILAGKHVSVVHNGVDNSVFAPGDQQHARELLGLPPDAFVVLLAGQTIEGIKEGIAAKYAIKALNQLRDERLHALLIGPSAALVGNQLSIAYTALPYQQQQSDMACCFQAADVSMVTSEYETFGMIAAESQACGTPVITFATGGLPEVVKHGVGGLVVPTGDVNGLIAGIKALLENTSMRNKMGEDGMTWVHEHFSNQMIAMRYISEYRTAMKERLGKG